jgi:hypothetical protein
MLYDPQAGHGHHSENSEVEYSCYLSYKQRVQEMKMPVILCLVFIHKPAKISAALKTNQYK